MTKFEELCRASNKAVVDMHRLKEECLQFGSVLVKGLVDYLECPSDRVSHYNLRDPNNPVGPVRLMDQATFVEDGWFYVGVGMNLNAAPPGIVADFATIMFNLTFKRVKDHYQVLFGRDKKEFTIHPSNQDEFNAAYEHLFRALKEYFETEAERSLDPRHGRLFGLR